MLDNVVLLLALVALLSAPWPPLSNAQIDALGTLVLALYVAALLLVGAAHYLFFIEHADYSMPVLILFIMSVLIRRQWRHSLANNVEVTMLCGICNTIITISAALIMAFGSGLPVPSALLVPVVLWELYAIRIHYAATSKGSCDGSPPQMRAPAKNSIITIKRAPARAALIV